MWSVTNKTPYAAGGAWGRDRDGVHEWIVAAKGCFDIGSDGGLTVSDEQPEPLLIPEYNGEDGTSSVRYDADLVGSKPTTDVVLNGTAYAPGGVPSNGFLATLRVGEIRKSIKIVGHRVWEGGMLGCSASEMKPVAQVPIVYERAYGGFDKADGDPKRQRMDRRNPVGCGLVVQEGLSLPNLEYPSGSIAGAGPAGFGALASFWSPRSELGGTYDEKWQNRRAPLLPVDWDPRSLLCSPADQQAKAHLEGGEQVELTNLTPGGVLRFALPRKRLRYQTLFKTRSGTRTRDHGGQLVTVILEPDFPRVVLVWVSVLSCPRDGDYLEETIVSEVPGP